MNYALFFSNNNRDEDVDIDTIALDRDMATRETARCS